MADARRHVVIAGDGTGLGPCCMLLVACCMLHVGCMLHVACCILQAAGDGTAARPLSATSAFFAVPLLLQGDLPQQHCATLGNQLAIIGSLLLPLTLELRPFSPEPDSAAIETGWASAVAAVHVQDALALLAFFALLNSVYVSWMVSCWVTLFGDTDVGKVILESLTRLLGFALSSFFVGFFLLGALGLWHAFMGHPILGVVVSVIMLVVNFLLNRLQADTFRHTMLVWWHMPVWFKGLQIIGNPGSWGMKEFVRFRVGFFVAHNFYT